MLATVVEQQVGELIDAWIVHGGGGIQGTGNRERKRFGESAASQYGSAENRMGDNGQP